MRSGTLAVLIFVLSCGLNAENLEKAHKKELESQAKAVIAEAKSLENSGQLAEARIKYAESQAMIEMKEASEAIKHLDDEIHKRVKEALSQSRKLYTRRANTKKPSPPWKRARSWEALKRCCPPTWRSAITNSEIATRHWKISTRRSPTRLTPNKK
jgi:hypothetical protein